MSRRRVFVTLWCLAVGALHVVAGPGYAGPWPVFVHGYLIDILLPASLYLLLGISGWKLLRSGALRAFAIWEFGAAVEVLQFLGAPLFGRTFDPLDLVAYAAGVALGALLEWAVLSRLPPD